MVGKGTSAEILDRLNCAIVKEFNRTNKENKFKDGMDVSLCVFNKDNSKLQFSGAGLPIYILRGKELIQVAGNRLSIGLSFKKYFHTLY